MTHPSGPGWSLHARPHVQCLLSLADNKILKASGPLKGLPLRAGFLIIKAENKEEVEAIVNGDPFAKEGLIVELTIQEWDPIFGVWESEASGVVPRGWREEWRGKL
ncbi:hypothetical protein G7Y89_g15420 [Cudoniella acicularis]|uniref:YCII-related domain-containing protein n=1 Tax=Cudoniella acicularis TaxID=354080 RepID=A0A8H4QNP7_9HELO|nr:hypothetical protein G7Y89_g15420 [Cudoniella acicularis]